MDLDRLTMLGDEGILITVNIFDKAFRGGSRTSPRRGRETIGGRLPNILVIFSEKPYEIKELLVRGGGGGRPP